VFYPECLENSLIFIYPKSANLCEFRNGDYLVQSLAFCNRGDPDSNGTSSNGVLVSAL